MELAVSEPIRASLWRLPLLCGLEPTTHCTLNITHSQLIYAILFFLMIHCCSHVTTAFLIPPTAAGTPPQMFPYVVFHDSLTTWRDHQWCSVSPHMSNQSHRQHRVVKLQTRRILHFPSCNSIFSLHLQFTPLMYNNYTCESHIISNLWQNPEGCLTLLCTRFSNNKDSIKNQLRLWLCSFFSR